VSGWSRGTAVALAVTVASAGLVGCGTSVRAGSAGDAGSSAPSVGAAATSTSSTGVPTSGAPTTGAPTSGAPTTGAPTSTGPDRSVPPSNGSVALTGTVQEGTRPQCVLLVADGTSYLLLGRPLEQGSRLRVGQRVSVLGTVRRDLRTSCQQGVPLSVRAVGVLTPLR
jgi:hypothetical protein